MEGNDWSCVVEGDPLLGSVSLPSIGSFARCVHFPSTNSGARLDLIMAFSRACSLGEMKKVAPSLQGGWSGCELGVGWRDIWDASTPAWLRLEVGVVEGAIAVSGSNYVWSEVHFIPYPSPHTYLLQTPFLPFITFQPDHYTRYSDPQDVWTLSG